MRALPIACVLVIVTAGCGRSGVVAPDAEPGIPTPRIGGGTPTPVAVGPYARTITIDASFVPIGQPLVNFPVRVALTSPEMRSEAFDGHVTMSSGWDIVFFDALGTPCAHEIEHYDPATGELRAWVSVPAVSADEDTIFSMEYGRSATAPSELPATVWASYDGVWHLDGNPAGAAPQARDSSPNANHATATGGMIGDDLVPGPTGFATRFDGVDDRLLIGNVATLDFTGAITVEAWFALDDDLDTMAGFPRLIDKYAGTNGGWGLFFNATAETLGIYTGDGAAAGIDQATTPFDPDVGDWHYAAGVWEPTMAAPDRIYVDGVEFAGVTNNNAITVTTAEASIGSDAAGGNALEGRIDEVRVTGGARSTQWIQTTHASIAEPDFLSIGPETSLAR